MDEQTESTIPVPVKEKRTTLTVSVAPEDAERLREAFAAGKLADLGVIDIQLIGDGQQKQWGLAEVVRRDKPKGDRTPQA